MQLTDGTTAVGVDITTQALKVYQVNETNTGTNVTNYATSSAVAASASSAHTYTTTSGKTLTLKQVIAAASGAMKVEIQTGAAGSETTKYVGFTSMARPTLDITFKDSLTVAAGQNTKVVRTNRESAAMDVYSTVIGSEA
jgi:hypothetical protein